MANNLNFELWSGVHNSFAVATSDSRVFEGDIWLAKSVDRLRLAIAEHSHRKILSKNSTTFDYILPAVAASLAKPDSTLRILDFGGGMAMTFLSVVDALPADQKLSFQVVESAALCNRVKQISFSDHRLSFHDQIPANKDGMDIVHAGSSIQYVEEWRGLLSRLCSFRPSHLILADIPAGELPHTFVTGQYFYGKRIAHWFFEIRELVEVVEREGYRLVYRAPYIGSFLGERRPLPMDGLPESHRLPSFSQLMFRRN